MIFSTQRKLLAVALTIGSLTIGSIGLSGCSSSEDRQAKYLERAQQSFDKKDYDKARIDLKNVLQINTSNAQARLLMAKLEERQQNWPQMFANLSAAVEADPKLIEARIKLAELLVGANQADNAEEQIQKVLALEPNNTEALAARAGLLYRAQKTEEAEALCLKILGIKPGHATATGLLAAIYGSNNLDTKDSDTKDSGTKDSGTKDSGATNLDKALTVIDEGVKYNPKDTTLQLLRIQILAKQNKVDAIIDAYQKLIQEKPEVVAFSAQLANLYISQQRNEEAEKTLSDAVARQPKQDEAKLLLVEFLAKNKKPEDARATLEKFSAAAPDNYKLRTALARIYLAMHEPDKAATTFQYAIDKDPKSADAIDARNRLTALALADNKRERADQLIAENLKIEPENTDALLTRARLALSDNNPDGASADARTVLKSSPESVPALEMLATAQERAGATSLALDNYQKLIQINGKNVGALIGAARLLKAENKLEDAQKYLEQAHTLAPASVEVTRELVDLYSRREQWQPALDLSKPLLEKPETAAVGYYLSGLVQARKKDFPAAIDAMRKSLEKEPRAIEPLQTLINLYLFNKQTDKAVAYVEQHVKDHPDHVHAQEFLATLYRQSGKADEAEKLLSTLLEKDPTRVSLYRELAAVYTLKNQRERIEPMLLKGLDKNPDNAGLMVLLAEIYQSTDKNQQALDQYNKLEKLQPHSAAIKNNLAALLIDKFPTEENLRRAQTLTADFSNSDNPTFIDTLGWLNYRLKNYPQAISLLEDAVHKRPQPELQYHLGMAYLRNNMLPKAKELLTSATAGKAVFSGRNEAEAELAKL